MNVWSTYVSQWPRPMRWLLLCSLFLLGFGTIRVGGQWWQVHYGPIDPEKGVHEVLTVDVNGDPQWLLLRGEDRSKPLLLFVHGGPGFPISFSANLPFSKDLERDFIVVHWDQRHAGHSFRSDYEEPSLTVDEQLADLDRITALLLEKFQRKQLYMAAHSWGTVASLLATQSFPERIAAYISICQVVNMEQNELRSFAFLKDEAKRRGHGLVEQVLDQVGPPPFDFDVRKVMVAKGVLQMYGGVMSQTSSLLNRVWGVFWNPYYSLWEYVKVIRGFFRTMHMLMPEFEKIQFDHTIGELKVPLVVMLGRHDYMTPSTIAETYFEGVRAPAKTVHWFESAAHFPYYDDPQKFVDIVRQTAKDHPIVNDAP